MEAVAERNHGKLRAIEFKGRMATLNVIRVKESDLSLIDEQLLDKVTQAPDFFRHLPILLDLEEVNQIDLSHLCSLFKKHRLTVLGLMGGNEEFEQQAGAADIAVLPASMFGNERRSPRQEPVERANASGQEKPEIKVVETATKQTPTVLVKQPVRSGQQIYARGADLVVVASVGAGAEVLADGHVHIYGPLRGRALAGVQGDADARIFCRSLEAELVSVSGSYMLSDDLPQELRSSPAQISLVNDQLRIDPI